MSEDLLSRITIEPGKCGGRPCIRGIRMRVVDILQMLAGGASETEILEDFPFLELEDIKAALAFAAATVDHPAVVAGLPPIDDTESYDETDAFIVRNRDVLNASIEKSRMELAAGKVSTKSIDDIIAEGRRRHSGR